MNKNLQLHFTTGEFARIFHISKHTLFHYDQIGLFSPAIRLENGYRYYSLEQLELFRVITRLKELDLPLQEIKAYLDRRSPEELVTLLRREQAQIRQKLQWLERMETFVRQKADLTQQACRLKPGVIRLERQPPEYLILTEAWPQVNEKNIARSLVEHIQYCDAHEIFSPYSIGETIPLETVEKGDFSSYNHYYTRVGQPPDTGSAYLKEAGRYLSVCHQGGYGCAPETYRQLLAYARAQGLTLQGPFFEDTLLDELTVRGYDQYLLKISIRVLEPDTG